MEGNSVMYMGSEPIPSFEELTGYDVNVTGKYEGVRQTLYDTNTYVQAGQRTMTFFQVPQGQQGKGLEDTNMETAGVLPAPKNFLVQSIELLFLPANAAIATTDTFLDDVYQFAKYGSLDFFIGSKSYLQEAPLGCFPPKTGLNVMGAIGDAATQFTYAHPSGRPYFINPNVLLRPTQNFNVKCVWDTLRPISADAKVVCKLDGVLYRLAQ